MIPIFPSFLVQSKPRKEALSFTWSERKVSSPRHTALTTQHKPHCGSPEAPFELLVPRQQKQVFKRLHILLPDHLQRGSNGRSVPRCFLVSCPHHTHYFTPDKLSVIARIIPREATAISIRQCTRKRISYKSVPFFHLFLCTV